MFNIAGKTLSTFAKYRPSELESLSWLITSSTSESTLAVEYFSLSFPFFSLKFPTSVQDTTSSNTYSYANTCSAYICQ